MPIQAPYLPVDRLREEAAKFLARYNPSGQIPVPIEHIVEYGFSIDIVPTPGLHSNFDIDSYPSSDLTEFHIDDFVYRQRPTRYRFSLAHELAHVLIHRDVMAELTFSSISEWKVAVCSIPADQYSWIEWQAYTLAGLILVPPDKLKAAFAESAAKAAEAGIDLREVGEGGRDLVESHIGRQFDVSRDVVSRRIKADGLWTD